MSKQFAPAESASSANTATPRGHASDYDNELASLLAERIRLVESGVSEDTALRARDYILAILVAGVLPLIALVIGGMQ